MYSAQTYCILQIGNIFSIPTARGCHYQPATAYPLHPITGSHNRPIKNGFRGPVLAPR